LVISCCLIILNPVSVKSEWNANDYLKKEHSLVKPYADDRWDYIGSTIVTNSYVRLTPDQQSRKGAIWNKMPCFLRNWELHVNFKVYGKGTELFGDGFAIWYTKERLELGPVFGNRDYFMGLAVFLDSYNNDVQGKHNHGHPYISAMVNNGTLHYDHDRDGTHTELAGCEARFRGAAYDTSLAVRYEHNRLTVSVDAEGKNSWKKCFSVDGVHLPSGYYFGASAATGELADNHDIISMKLYDIAVESVDDGVDYRNIVPSAENFAPHRDHVHGEKGESSSGSGWGTFFYVLFILLVISGVIAAGYYLYMKSTEKKRLY